MILARLFSKIYKEEDSGIILVDNKGQKYICGNPRKDKPITIKLLNKNLNWKLVLDPELEFPEAYMRNEIIIENASLKEFLMDGRVLDIPFLIQVFKILLYGYRGQSDQPLNKFLLSSMSSSFFSINYLLLQPISHSSGREGVSLITEKGDLTVSSLVSSNNVCQTDQKMMILSPGAEHCPGHRLWPVRLSLQRGQRGQRHSARHQK